MNKTNKVVITVEKMLKTVGKKAVLVKSPRSPPGIMDKVDRVRN